MKQFSIIAAVVSLLFLQTGNLLADPAEWVTKEKKINKHYTVQPADRLLINNKFGKLQINTWDKNEITVNITITAKSKSEDKSQEMLDNISIDEESNENGNHDISFTTVISKSNNNSNNEIRIDYVVNMPKRNALDIKNKFGDVSMDDFEGKMQVDVEYGALNTQRISGKDKQVRVAFGSADISYMETGRLDISYSKLSIDKAQDINVTNKFGKSVIGSVEDLDIKQSYGDLTIGTVNKIKGNVDYAGLYIDKLTKNFDMAIKYCGKASIGSIGKGVGLVNLNASYSSINCHLEENANLSVDVTSMYSTIKNYLVSKEPETVEIKTGGSSTQRYTWKTGNGDGKMDVDMHYSNLTIK